MSRLFFLFVSRVYDYQKKTSDFIRQNSTLMDFDKNSWCILNPIERSIKEKIEKIGVPLKDWNIKIYRGILTGCNEAFIIDGATKDALIAQDPKSAEIIRPILRGRDIKRYSYEFADKWLIATHNGTETQKRIDINDYPAVKAHLDSYYAKIAKRDDQGDTPYNLRCCAYWDDFSKQKIVYSEIVREPQFFLDYNGQFFVEATAFLMTGERLEYLSILLHSKILTFIFKTYYAGGGLGSEGYRYKKAFLEKLPIPIPTKEIEGNVMHLKSCSKFNEIEIEIAKLYDLSAEEFNFITTLY